MRIFDLLATCVRSLLRRKVRTLLTIIGVVIGTCAIIVTISLGEGMNKQQMDMISQWTDLTTIQVYQNWDVSGQNTEIAKLDDAAVEAFKAIGDVKAVSPTMSMWNQVKLISGKWAYTSSIRAIDLTLLEDLGYEMKEGDFPTGDMENTVLFGESAMFNFQDTQNPDNWIQYEYDEEGNIISDPPVNVMRDKLRYQIIILEEQNNGNVTYYADSKIIGGDIGGDDGDLTPEEQAALDEKIAANDSKAVTVGGILKGDYAKDDGNTFYSVYIDISFAKELIKQYNRINDIKPTNDDGTPRDPNYLTYEQILVKVDDMNNVDAVETAIQDMGYSTNSFESQRKPLQEQTRQIQLLFGGLGAISLLVAAIGIANTMVMSIYERTREIGVMKVLGCELSDIRWMFLIEAAMIGLLGGLVGLGLSFGISAIINAFQTGESYTSIIPAWLVLLGLSFSTGVGIVSGFSPANRAVRISALSAIRQE